MKRRRHNNGEKDRYAEMARKVREGTDDGVFLDLVDDLSSYFESLYEKWGHKMPAGMDENDVHQEFVIGLHEACMKHNKGRGAFLPYAKLWIRRHLITVMMGSKGGLKEL